MATLWQDVRYAFRMLAKSPLLMVIVILTLALGIGANTAIFGLVNGLLLRPLPVKSPEQIMVLAGQAQGDTLAALAEPRLASMVYLGAFVTGPGQSLGDVEPPEVAERYRRQVAEKGDGWFLPAT